MPPASLSFSLRGTSFSAKSPDLGIGKAIVVEWFVVSQVLQTQLVRHGVCVCAFVESAVVFSMAHKTLMVVLSVASSNSSNAISIKKQPKHKLHISGMSAVVVLSSLEAWSLLFAALHQMPPLLLCIQQSVHTAHTSPSWSAAFRRSKQFLRILLRSGCFSRFHPPFTPSLSLDLRPIPQRTRLKARPPSVRTSKELTDTTISSLGFAHSRALPIFKSALPVSCLSLLP